MAENLSQAEIQELFKQYAKEKSLDIRNKLLEAHLYIAEIVAKKFIGRGVEYDDLYQVASLALIKVIDRYEVDRGIKFSSFATPSLVGEVKNYFRDKSRVLRVPRKDSEQLVRLSAAMQTLSQKLGVKPNASQLAKHMDITEERVLELLEVQKAGSVMSLERYLNPDDETELSQVLGEDDFNFSRIEDREFLSFAFKKLSDTERTILTERFIKDKTQREVAQMLGVSQMYVSRYERRTLKKLQELYNE